MTQQDSDNTTSNTKKRSNTKKSVQFNSAYIKEYEIDKDTDDKKSNTLTTKTTDPNNPKAQQRRKDHLEMKQGIQEIITQNLIETLLPPKPPDPPANPPLKPSEPILPNPGEFAPEPPPISKKLQLKLWLHKILSFLGPLRPFTKAANTYEEEIKNQRQKHEKDKDNYQKEQAEHLKATEKYNKQQAQYEASLLKRAQNYTEQLKQYNTYIQKTRDKNSRDNKPRGKKSLQKSNLKTNTNDKQHTTQQAQINAELQNSLQNEENHKIAQLKILEGKSRNLSTRTLKGKKSNDHKFYIDEYNKANEPEKLAMLVLEIREELAANMAKNQESKEYDSPDNREEFIKRIKKEQNKYNER